MGWMDKVGGTLFGESGTEWNESLDPNQLAARNRQINALAGAVDNAGSALGGYTQTGYNAYDEADGAGQFERMKGFLTSDANKQANQVSGGNMGRFSRGAQASIQGVRDAYNKNMLGADQARLQAQTAGRQNAYSNQMNAIQQALGGNQAMLGNTRQSQATQSTGLLDILGGVAGGMGSIDKILGGGTSTGDKLAAVGGGGKTMATGGVG